MKRRRLVIVLVTLFIVAALGAWKWTHRHDARLAGRWLVTESSPPTAEQLRAATDRANFDPKQEWTLASDGAGRMSGRQWAGSTIAAFGSELHWWTNGDRLRIKWGLSRPGWESLKESAADLSRVLRGDPPQNPVLNYDIVIEGPDLIRVQPGNTSWDPSPKVLYLSRLPEDDP
ncbi:MAG: hypothetical protein JNG89_18650 [Planctomycetaceae bacterium]|nr:hypothetical protein [Planctomycetaceae bacterium]